MQDPCRTASSFVDTLLQALHRDPVIWLLLWERYNYGQIGVAMGDRKESGLRVGEIAIFVQTHFG